MSPPNATPTSTPSGLRRAVRSLQRRARRAVAAVTDGLGGLVPPGSGRRQPVLVPIPVRSTERARRV